MLTTQKPCLNNFESNKYLSELWEDLRNAKDAIEENLQVRF